MPKINGGGVRSNPFGPDWGGPVAEQQEVQQTTGEEVESNLFGKPKPPIVEPKDAEMAALLGRLTSFKDRIARLAGDTPSEYRLTLAQGTIAMIDQSGLIYVGDAFLENYGHSWDVLVGVLAHEIGHRPKRWREYHKEIPQDKEAAEKLCRLEETRADYFSGRALAEFGFDCEPLVRFLLHISDTPHPEYFPADMRAEVIREGFEDGSRQSRNMAKFFPEFSRMQSAGGDLGEG